jgi:hypothetical protein
MNLLWDKYVITSHILASFQSFVLVRDLMRAGPDAPPESFRARLRNANTPRIDGSLSVNCKLLIESFILEYLYGEIVYNGVPV